MLAFIFLLFLLVVQNCTSSVYCLLIETARQLSSVVRKHPSGFPPKRVSIANIRKKIETAKISHRFFLFEYAISAYSAYSCLWESNY